MLEELNIKNFALIDSAHVEFNKGFTVLSGETGAGKSILIGSLAFLLGGKAGMEQIRTGCHEAEVSGVFLIECKEGFNWLEEHSIEHEDGRIILRRVIRDTAKSSSWIGGTPVTRADLAEFAEFLVDIHGQHQQQSLMKVAEHRRFLDIYAGIVDEVQEVTKLYTELVDKRRALESLNTNEHERTQRIEMLNYAVSEIENAKLKPGEDEELESEENKLSSFEKLYSDIESINSLFDGSGEGNGILQLMKKLNSIVPHASSMDKSLEEFEDRLQSAYYELDDLSNEFSRYGSELVFDPERLVEVQERIDQIYKLKKKYVSTPTATVQDVLDYAEKARSELETLTGAGADRSTLEKLISELEKRLYSAGKQVSEKRKTASDKMAGEVEGILYKLGMKETKFRVNLEEKPGNDMVQKFGPYGMDNIEFLISANPGSPLLPLARIASGGELSRVMLALKTILSKGDTVSTLIFDEIDTGIGGEVAVSIGAHMKKLSQEKQILCITHLASIASCADNQIKIQKGVDGNSTQTQVFPVEGNDRVAEIARMLSGDSVSSESLEYAKSLLEKSGGI